MGIRCQNTTLNSDISRLTQREKSLPETLKLSSLPQPQKHLTFSLGGCRLSVVTDIYSIAVPISVDICVDGEKYYCMHSLMILDRFMVFMTEQANLHIQSLPMSKS